MADTTVPALKIYKYECNEITSHFVRHKSPFNLLQLCLLYT